MPSDERGTVMRYYLEASVYVLVAYLVGIGSGGIVYSALGRNAVVLLTLLPVFLLGWLLYTRGMDFSRWGAQAGTMDVFFTVLVASCGMYLFVEDPWHQGGWIILHGVVAVVAIRQKTLRLQYLSGSMAIV